jgi:UDP-N-acetylglucosamine 2-epimerase (non-hydrolysing)
MHILHVAGARPNFMKVAPVMRALARFAHVRQTLVHTGQHYDALMSDVFFCQLGLPAPDVNLQAGSGTQAVQTAEVMVRFEPVVREKKPDLVLVYGDVNSTLAAALVCAKLGQPVAHVEAGLRSFDRTMPEEVNRVLTDQLADILFTSSPECEANLRHEGADRRHICFVGNVMIDTLVRLQAEARTRAAGTRLHEYSDYALVTLHRPANVDDPVTLRALLDALLDVSSKLPVVFPVHPRTRKSIQTFNGRYCSPSLKLLEPVGYLEFLRLQQCATVVVTDSGGIQEETTWLGVPCLTVRENTERPVTVSMGTNVLVGRDMARLRAEVDSILNGRVKQAHMPPLWDGRAAERIAEVIIGQGLP